MDSSSTHPNESLSTKRSVIEILKEVRTRQQDTLKSSRTTLLNAGWNPQDCYLKNESLYVANPEWDLCVMGNAVTGGWVVRIRGDPDGYEFPRAIELMGEEFRGAVKAEIERVADIPWPLRLPGRKKEKKSIANEFVSTAPVFGNVAAIKRRARK